MVSTNNSLRKQHQTAGGNDAVGRKTHSRPRTVERKSTLSARLCRLGLGGTFSRAQRTSRRRSQRLLDLAGELCPADDAGLREGLRDSRQVRAFLLRRGARARHGGEEQSAG